MSIPSISFSDFPNLGESSEGKTVCGEEYCEKTQNVSPTFIFGSFGNRGEKQEVLTKESRN